MTILLTLFSLAVQIYGSLPAYAHAGHHAGASAPLSTSQDQEALRAIGRDYQGRIAPIFAKSCSDCHTSQTRYPWYYAIPGVKQLIDSDISEARSHLDFTAGFPFISHASPIEDLDAIEKSLKEESMPPLDYRLMHSEARMKEAEKATVLDWIETSRKLLKSR